jgi:hypothetical protein
VDSKTHNVVEIKSPTTPLSEPREKKVLAFKHPITREEIPVHQQPANKAIPIKDPITRKVIEVTPVPPTETQPKAEVAPSPVIAAVPTPSSNSAPNAAASAHHPSLALGLVKPSPTHAPPTPVASPTVGVWPKAQVDDALVRALEMEADQTEDGQGLPHTPSSAPAKLTTKDILQSAVVQSVTSTVMGTNPAQVGPEVEERPEAETSAEVEEEEEEELEEIEEEVEEEDEEEEEEEEDPEGDRNGLASAILTQKDTWGLFASIGTNHVQDSGLANGMAQVPLNTNAETTLASLQSAEDHSEIQVAEPKHLDDNNDEAQANNVKSEPEVSGNESTTGHAEAAEDKPKELYRLGSRPPSPGRTPPVSPLAPHSILGSRLPEKPKPTGVSGFTAMDSVVLAPRASWGCTVPPISTVKKPLVDHGAANLRDDKNKSAIIDEKICTTANGTSGKKVYTREQLKALEQICVSLPPPDSLKRCECFKENSRPRQNAGPPKDSRSIFQTQRPAFAQGPAAYTSLTGAKAETAFSLQNTRKVDNKAKVLQKVRGILNKITQQTFGALSAEMWQLLVTHKLMETTETLDRVVETIFEVALTQANFGPLCAEICLLLHSKIKTLKKPGADGEEVEAAPQPEFRRLLLNQCQAMFDRSCGHSAEEIPADATEEQIEVIKKTEEGFRMQSLANITFMAQLFNRSLLSERIMHLHVIRKLLDKDHSDEVNSWLLEFLLKLLELTGKKLDRDLARQTMDGYFSKLDTISKTHPDTRLRHLTFNIIEMRKSGWKTRQEVKDSDESMSSVVRQRATEWAIAQADFQRKEDERTKKDAAKSKKLVGGKTSKEQAKKADAKGVAHKEAAAAKQSADVTVAALSEEQLGTIESLAKSTMTEYAQNFLSEDEVVAQVESIKEEYSQAPTCGLSNFFCSMVHHSVSNNKRTKERELFPQLVRLLQKHGIVKKEALQQAFVKFMDAAVATEMWVDVPKLWSNLGDILSKCIADELVDFDVIILMMGPICNEEDYLEVAPEFVNSTLQVLDERGYDEFDGDKASRVVWTLQKAYNKGKKTKKPARPSSIADLMTALEKVGAQ